MMLSVHSDEHFMKEAYKEAQIAYEEGEVPVGAVVVAKNRIIAKAHNMVERLNDVTAHAEMLAITSAANTLGSKYLNECTLYVTLEPCAMCGGALHWSQLNKLVFAASDNNRGFQRLQPPVIHPKTEIISGVLKTECEALINDFFKTIRKG